MQRRPAGFSIIASYAILLCLAVGCGASPTASEPVLQTQTFTGTSDLSVIVNSLTNVAGTTPVTGITIGLGLGAPSGATCSLQLQTAVAGLGQEMFAPNGATAGNYCVQISDCPTGSTGCASTLAEAVTYSITVKHY